MCAVLVQWPCRTRSCAATRQGAGSGREFGQLSVLRGHLSVRVFAACRDRSRAGRVSRNVGSRRPASARQTATKFPDRLSCLTGRGWLDQPGWSDVTLLSSPVVLRARIFQTEPPDAAQKRTEFGLFRPRLRARCLFWIGSRVCFARFGRGNWNGRWFLWSVAGRKFGVEWSFG
jgi:hypothetical protein